MSEVPYTNIAGKIKEYLDKFKEASVPEKATQDWLSSIGFKGKNDRAILRILKAMKFTDNSGVPTERWRRFKNPQIAKTVLSEGIRDAYSDLFQTYEDAYRKDREALYAYFSSKTGLAKNTIDLIVNTFVNLCALADFGAEPSEPPQAPAKGEEGPTTKNYTIFSERSSP